MVPPLPKPDSVAGKIRSRQRWQRTRAWVRAHNPICADPFGDHAKAGRVVPSTEVHHKIPLHIRPDLAHSAGNLMALCTVCHGKLEKRVRDGQA